MNTYRSADWPGAEFPPYLDERGLNDVVSDDRPNDREDKKKQRAKEQVPDAKDIENNV